MFYLYSGGDCDVFSCVYTNGISLGHILDIVTFIVFINNVEKWSEHSDNVCKSWIAQGKEHQHLAV